MAIPFTTADLPQNTFACTTVEELNTWTAGILQFNYATASYTEAANTNPLFHYIQPQLRIPSAELVIVNRCAIVIDESKAQNLPQWKRIKGLAAVTAIPAGFKLT